MKPEQSEVAETNLFDPATLLELLSERSAILADRCHDPRVEARDSRLFRSYPRLDCSPWLARVSDAYLYQVIAEGGTAVGRSELMKPFGSQLSESEILSLIAFLRRPAASAPAPTGGAP